MNASDDPSSICSQHTETLTVGALRVDVVRKGISELQIEVVAPQGRVRVAAPLASSDAEIEQAVAARRDWIAQQQAVFKGQADNAALATCGNGAPCWWLGQRLVLRARPATGTATAAQLDADAGLLWLSLPAGCFESGEVDAEQCQVALEQAWQAELEHRIVALLPGWQRRLEVEVAQWSVQAMASRWGNCNPRSARLVLNTALAQKPPACIEFVLVHELVHLRERRHGPAFDALMQQHMADWREREQSLHGAPAAHPGWGY